MREPVPYSTAIAIAITLACSAGPEARAPDRRAAPGTASGDTSPTATGGNDARSDAEADSARPVFEIDLWPGEGIPVLESVADVLVLRERPSTTSEVAHELRLAPGTRLAFDSTRYQTLVPGPLRVLAPTEIRGRVLGDIDRLTRSDYYSSRVERSVVPVDPTSRLELLQYRAEGRCFVRLAEQVIEAERCPAMGDSAFALVREPETRWWIRVGDGDARAGWLLVTDAAVRVVRRRF